MLVLSTEQNPVVEARCKKLQLPLMQRVDDKLPALKQWLSEQGADPAHVIYVGNDVNDLECLEFVGCGVGPATSHPSVLGILNLVSSAIADTGIVREIADAIVGHMTGIYEQSESSLR